MILAVVTSEFRMETEWQKAQGERAKIDDAWKSYRQIETAEIAGTCIWDHLKSRASSPGYQENSMGRTVCAAIRLAAWQVLLYRVAWAVNMLESKNVPVLVEGERKCAHTPWCDWKDLSKRIPPLKRPWSSPRYSLIVVNAATQVFDISQRKNQECVLPVSAEALEEARLVRDLKIDDSLFKDGKAFRDSDIYQKMSKTWINTRDDWVHSSSWTHKINELFFPPDEFD